MTEWKDGGISRHGVSLLSFAARGVDIENGEGQAIARTIRAPSSTP
jgi:hypothetical protein